jgi:threonine/homoserine/homoserine lactone efflux protein
MGEAIGQVLPLAVAVALSPFPIVAIVLVLATPRARVNGPMFVLGCLIGLAVVGIVVLALVGPAGASEGRQPATWVDGVKIVLGGLLLLLAVRQWRSRPRQGEEVKEPAWMGAIDSFTPGRALGAGVVLAGVNPKNLLLAAGAAATIAQTGIPIREQAIAYAVFALIGLVGVGTPLVLSFALGERSKPMLDGLKEWMTRNNDAIMAAICLLIGVKLIGDAISGLSA